MTNCLFCKIVAGETPSTKVYENDHVLAFLDIHPVNIGHTLVIPKTHSTNLYETEDMIVGEVAKAVKKVATGMKDALAADGINVEMNNDAVAGQIIFHAHTHIIPRFEGDGFTHWHGRRGYEDGEEKEVAEKISAKLK